MTRPLAVRVLRATGVAALVAGIVAMGIGALLRFDELAKIWGVIGGLLLAIALTALLGAKPSRGGLLSGMVACLLMLFLLPVGTFVTATLAIIASQTWPQLRDYYRLRGRAA
jgi:hypothetical protein